MISGLFLGSAVQQLARANESSTSGQRAVRVAADLQTKSQAIACDVEKLYMITEALWTMLKEQHGYRDEDLVLRIQDIDLRDGKLDGKVAGQMNPACPQCGRVLLGKHPVCLYCGTAVMRDPFER